MCVPDHVAPVSSSDVNRALREAVWPALKEAGFDRRTQRTAWRDRPDQVDVVSFQALNSYSAGVFRVTPFSFQLSLGTHPRCRETDQIRERGGLLRPDESCCDFRCLLRKGFAQPETDRPEVWSVDPDASNLRAVVETARRVLVSEGLAWFDELDGVEAMLAKARTAPEDMETTWGMGNLGSPHRQVLVDALELAARRVGGDERST